MAGVAQAQVFLVQVQTKPGKVVILSADVGGQDQGAQLPLHVQAEEMEGTATSGTKRGALIVIQVVELKLTTGLVCLTLTCPQQAGGRTTPSP